MFSCTLAVKIVSNLSLVESNRTAVAEAGILDTIIQVIRSSKSDVDEADLTQLVLKHISA